MRLTIITALVIFLAIRSCVPTTCHASDIPPAVWLVQGSDIPPKRAEMVLPKGPIYLMDITLNAQTGEEISRKIRSGPYELGQCVEAQRQTGIQRAVVTPGGPPSITLIECAVSHVDVAS